MKRLLIIPVLLIVACCANKKQTTATPVAKEPNNAADSLLVSAVPGCIDSLIHVFKAEKVQNPPRKIYRYQYQNKTVYYVPAICCDFFSELYDDKCSLIGHPDGGFTGKGDGSMPDFHSAKKNEVLVWEDKRKQ
ncbi:MAG: hypothetical protein QM687_02510 [Ferruginibacter sp.]